MGCSSAVVYDRLDRAGIERRRHDQVPPSREVVIPLYVEDRLSPAEIGRIVGKDAVTIRRYLRSWGVKTRTFAESRIPRACRPAPTDVTERGYLLGFVTGDLAVQQRSAVTGIVELASSTTRAAQRDLVHSLFDAYGPVRESGRSMRVTLDRSFDFLLAKYRAEVPPWVSADREATAGYLAGYIDAEGSFGVYSGRGRFKLDSYDAHVLHFAAAWCAHRDIHVICRQLTEAGAERWGVRWNGDLVRLTINRAPALERFIATIGPYLRHADRRAAAAAVQSNVLERRRGRDRHQSPSGPQHRGPRGSREVDAHGPHPGADEGRRSS